MSIIRSLLTPAKMRATAPGSYDMSDYMRWLSDAGFPLINQSWTMNEERVEGDFSGLVRTAYQSNGVVFACLMTRFLLFSEARFQFQEMRRGRPGDLFGTPALQLLERPEPGKTTADLLSLALLDADLSGDWFGVRRPGAIKRLRPDWTMILVGSKNKETEYPGADPDAEIVGYTYSPNGLYSSGEIWPFGREEVAHFAPIPDPLARYRGMPLLTAAVREIAGDSAASTQKRKLFENAAVPGLVVKFPPMMDKKKAQDHIDVFEQEHVGAFNAYRTMYLLGGAEIQAVGLDYQKLEYKATVGAGETRIASVLNVRPEVVGLSEGLQGTALSGDTLSPVRRLQADKMLRPSWRNMAGSLETIIPPLPGTRLWYDDRDIPFLRDDIKDAAAVVSENAKSIAALFTAGAEWDAAVDAVTSGDLKRLSGQHTGMSSVQLVPPGDAVAVAARAEFWPSSGDWESIGQIERGDLFTFDHPLVARFPSLFERVASTDGRAIQSHVTQVRIYKPEQPLLTAGDEAPSIVTREEVVAKRAELEAAGRPAGYDSLARALNVSAATIRRRLGVLDAA
jgi:hypothetical protein